MFEKLRLKIASRLAVLETKREKILIYGAVTLTVIFSVWALWTPPNQPPEVDKTLELGATIPKGFSIVPLELSNAEGLSGMISKTAIIDVFLKRQKEPLIENLRVLKLSAGEGPLFGALIPEKILNNVQNHLSESGLRGVLKPVGAGSTKVHFLPKKSRLIEEISISEDI